MTYNLEIFCSSEGYVEAPSPRKRESKLKEINTANNFRVLLQNGRCIRFYSERFPDLIKADWNTEPYIGLEDQEESVFTFGEVTYKKKSIFIDNVLVEGFEIDLGRKFFSNINLSQQMSSVSKIIRTIIGIWD